MVEWYWIPAVGIPCFLAGLGWSNYLYEQNKMPVDHSADSDNVTSNESTED